MKFTVAIIGAGAAGQVMGCLLARAGHDVVALSNRSVASAERARKTIGHGRVYASPAQAAGQASLVLITTPDDVIEHVCRQIAGDKGFRPDALVIHCSGCYSSEILTDARRCGARVGSIHPLKSLADVPAAVAGFAGTYCGYEGDEPSMEALDQIVRDLGGRGIRLRSDGKELYHAAAVFASNYLVVLFDLALRLFDEAGIRPEQSCEALQALSQGTLNNLQRQGVPAALTGPVERGDLLTVQRHLDALGGLSREVQAVYAHLGIRAVEVALSKGSLGEPVARRLREIFETVKERV